MRVSVVSFVLKIRLKSLSKPTLQMNSFNKRAPASEDKSPPLKFIFAPIK